MTGIPIGMTSSTIGLKICTITVGIKKYQSIIKKKKKKHDKIASLGKPKLNGIKVLTCKSLIDSNVSHDEVNSINNVKAYEEKKEQIKNFMT